MILKFKKIHVDATLPKYAVESSAALDMTCVARVWNEVNQNFEYDTGVAVEIPEGYVGLLFPRSSVANTRLILSNSVGVIDPGYRGTVVFKFRDLEYGEGGAGLYNPGDRIGQLLIVQAPQVTPVFVEKLSDSVRGTGGFGSTGK